MPDVISNTSPLLYLHLIGRLDVLSSLYRRINVPSGVVDELRQGELRGFDVPSPAALPWVNEQAVDASNLQRVSPSIDPGEREALALALGKPDPLVIVDDAAARAQAATLRIPFTGTLGVLVKAKQAGLINDVSASLDDLDRAGFYLNARVRAKVIQLAGESP